jgi:hypothetical protein
MNRIIKLRVRPNDNEVSFDYKKRMLDLLLEENIIDEPKYREVFHQISINKSTIGFNKGIDEIE